MSQQKSVLSDRLLDQRLAQIPQVTGLPKVYGHVWLCLLSVANMNSYHSIFKLASALLPHSLRHLLKKHILHWPDYMPSDTLSPKSAAQLLPSLRHIRPNRYDVIILPIIYWRFRFQRPQQIATQFAHNGHRVFYLRTTFTGSDESIVQPIQPNVIDVQLPGPAQMNLYQRRLDETQTAQLSVAFQELRRRYHILNAVCLVQLPFWTPVALELRQRFGWKAVYDCMDHHAGFSTNSDAMLSREEKLITESDLVLTTSQALQERLSRMNPRCIRVPNAADFDHFHPDPGDIPAELTDVPRPIIGYYGAISDWFDIKLVETLADARPGWSFVLIGSTYGADVRGLARRSNVYLLGEKPYAALPACLHRFDVCLIPFLRNALTEATNPVKLYEYLSAGKPVVATDLPELAPFSELIHLARMPGEWLAAIESALTDKSPQAIQARIELARENTWAARFDVIRTAIRSLYPRASIVIVTYNNLELTKLCVESVFQRTLYPDYEIIVVDNASTDDTRSYLQELEHQHAGVKVILNGENAGFARANNQGIAAAEGDYIVLLNNDTIVTLGWLTTLLRHLDDPEVGMVGPVTNWAGNEALIQAEYETIEEMETFAEQYTMARDGKHFDIPVPAMFCVAMRRRTFDEIGPLDERFGLGTFEDDDYARRMKAHGYRLICAEDVFIHHFGQASFARMDKTEYKQLFETNRRRFEEKWGARWTPHNYRSLRT